MAEPIHKLIDNSFFLNNPALPFFLTPFFVPCCDGLCCLLSENKK
jgi:hypothetical protein